MTSEQFWASKSRYEAERLLSPMKKADLLAFAGECGVHVLKSASRAVIADTMIRAIGRKIDSELIRQIEY